MYDTNARPLLRAFMTPLYLKSTANGSKTYDGSVNFSTGSVKDPGALPKLFAGTLTLVLDDPNAGYRQAVASGYYSDQVGYPQLEQPVSIRGHLHFQWLEQRGIAELPAHGL